MSVDSGEFGPDDVATLIGRALIVIGGDHPTVEMSSLYKGAWMAGAALATIVHGPERAAQLFAHHMQGAAELADEIAVEPKDEPLQ